MNNQNVPEGQPSSLIQLEVDGEKVQIPQDIAVGWRDILKARVGAFIDFKQPVSSTLATEFNYGVLSDLREDINLIRTAQWIKPVEEWQTDKEIYRQLRTRYHPDLFVGESDEVKKLAQEYFQALGALKEAGELQIDVLKVEV